MLKPAAKSKSRLQSKTKLRAKRKPVEIVILGAGGRGAGYARFAGHFPDRLRIVGVAEPREWYRENLAKLYKIPRENVARDWRELAERARFADGVIVATQDAMHVDPTVEFAKKKYSIMLEKPMAPDEAGCRKIVKAVMDNRNIFVVCHVMRYTVYTRKLKELLEAGAVGDIVSMQHMEGVAFWHQAHSYVRGNWRNEKESSSMLLAKSCHDLDWIRHLMGNSCVRVASFGNLFHFRKENKPKGSANRCLDCKVAKTCPYDAARFYLGMVARGAKHWPVNVLTPVVTRANVLEALRKGPYGRCVYACDNDVVDHQVVNMSFEKGQTASFTMTAFGSGRKTRIFGTRGQIYGDGVKIEHEDFLTRKTKTYDMAKLDQTILGGHGGGDGGVMDSFVTALETGDTSKILTGPRETLETHLSVFAAEKARKTNSVVNVVV